MHRGLLSLALVLLVPACAPMTPTERAGSDQEIARDILWAYHNDPQDRFKDARVHCFEHEVVLEGRVNDAQTALDALEIANDRARGAKVRSTLEVRPR